MTGTSSGEVRIASLGMRALGAIVDILIIAAIWSVFGLAFGKPPEVGIGFSFEGIPALLSLLAMFGYYIASEALWGATPAKMLLGMRVVREEDGGRIDWMESAIRNLLRIVDGFPALYLVGFFFAVSSSRTQRLGDRAARTVVVRA